MLRFFLFVQDPRVHGDAAVRFQIVQDPVTRFQTVLRMVMNADDGPDAQAVQPVHGLQQCFVGSRRQALDALIFFAGIVQRQLNAPKMPGRQLRILALDRKSVV